MRLGLGSYACAWEIGVPGSEPRSPLDVRGLAARARQLGLSLVQIADNLPLDEPVTDLGIDVELGTRGVDPPLLLRYLGLCRAMGSPILRTIVTTSPEEAVETLRPLMPRFAEAGVVLALENHDRFDSRTFVGIVERIGSPHVGICLDTVNSFGALEGPDVTIGTLAPYVVNLHVKDFVIRRHPSMMGFEITGAPAGQGRLDIPALLEKLRAHGRDPNAILELWPPPEQDAEATIEKERRWAEESVRYLRTLVPQ